MAKLTKAEAVVEAILVAGGPELLAEFKKLISQSEPPGENDG
jgi:hypothetical protein